MQFLFRETNKVELVSFCAYFAMFISSLFKNLKYFHWKIFVFVKFDLIYNGLSSFINVSITSYKSLYT